MMWRSRAEKDQRFAGGTLDGQVLAERISTDPDSPGDCKMEYVWGAQYIDEIVCRIDHSGDGIPVPGGRVFRILIENGYEEGCTRGAKQRMQPSSNRLLNASAQSLVAFHVKGLPLEKRLAEDALLKRFVRREGRCIDFPLFQQQVQKFTFWIIQG